MIAPRAMIVSFERDDASSGSAFTIVSLSHYESHIDLNTALLYFDETISAFQIHRTDLFLHVVPGLPVGICVILDRFLQRVPHRHAEIVFEHRRCYSHRQLDHEDYKQRGRKLY